MLGGKLQSNHYTSIVTFGQSLIQIKSTDAEVSSNGLASITADFGQVVNKALKMVDEKQVVIESFRGRKKS